MLRFGQVTVVVLGEVEVVIDTADRCPEVGDEAIDLVDRLQFTGGAFADDDRALCGARAPADLKLAQASMGPNGRSGVVWACPSREGVACIVVDRIEAHVRRITPSVTSPAAMNDCLVSEPSGLTGRHTAEQRARSVPSKDMPYWTGSGSGESSALRWWTSRVCRVVLRLKA